MNIAKLQFFLTKKFEVLNLELILSHYQNTYTYKKMKKKIMHTVYLKKRFLDEKDFQTVRIYMACILLCFQSLTLYNLWNSW